MFRRIACCKRIVPEFVLNPCADGAVTGAAKPRYLLERSTTVGSQVSNRASSILATSQSRIRRGKDPYWSRAKYVTAVASLSVPVLDAVSMTANAPSHRAGKGTGRLPLAASREQKIQHLPNRRIQHGIPAH